METRSLDDVLAAARAKLDRIAPESFDSAVAAGAVVIDVRDSALRDRQGSLAGAHVIDLTILEWRVAPSSRSRTIEVLDGQQVILVCSEGFSSSLAAARLQALGVRHTTDLIGGFTALAAYREAQT